MALLLFDRETRNEFKRLSRLLTLGLEIPLSVFVGYFGGSWLDTKLGTDPWLMWIGLGCGVAAASLSFYRVARWAQREMNKEEP